MMNNMDSHLGKGGAKVFGSLGSGLSTAPYRICTLSRVYITENSVCRFSHILYKTSLVSSMTATKIHIISQADWKVGWRSKEVEHRT